MEQKIGPTACHFGSYPLELKSLAADGTFAGYASVFGIVDSQRDVVKQGAFRKSIAARGNKLQLLWQHHWDAPIGSIEKIFEDARGLYVEGRLLMDVAKAREAYALLKAGVIKGLSIGFTAPKTRRNPDSGIRELLEIDLWEVSVVTLPANEAAQVTVLKRATPQNVELAYLADAVKRAERALLS